MGEPHGAATLLRLRLSQGEALAVVDAGERPLYPHCGVLQVDVLPLEAQQFPAPHTGVDGDHVKGFEPVATSRLEQLADLAGGEGTHLFRCWCGRLDRV